MSPKELAWQLNSLHTPPFKRLLMPEPDHVTKQSFYPNQGCPLEYNCMRWLLFERIQSLCSVRVLLSSVQL